MFRREPDASTFYLSAVVSSGARRPKVQQHTLERFFDRFTAGKRLLSKRSRAQPASSLGNQRLIDGKIASSASSSRSATMKGATPR